MIGSLLALLPVAALDAPQVPFDSPRGLIIVEAEVNNGERARLIVDTGAGATVLHADFADKLGLQKGGEITAQGGGGNAAARQVKGFSLRGLSGSERTYDAYALPLGSIGLALGTRIDGILGTDVLRHYVLDIDYAAKRVRFGSPESFRPDPKWTAVPFKLKGNRPTIPVTLRTPDGREIVAETLIDTGSNLGIKISGPFADKHALKTTGEPPMRLAGVGGTWQAFPAEVPSVTIGGVQIDKPSPLIARGGNQGGAQDALIGHAILGRYRVIVDYPGSRLFLAPAK